MIIVRRANTQDAPIVACLVDALLAELGNTPSKLEERAAMAPHLLAMDDRIFGFLAYEDAEPVGVMMVSESHSIYASGAFGVITELYVVPSYRSSGVAQRLIGSGASLRSVPRASPRGPAACNSISAAASPRSVRAGCSKAAQRRRGQLAGAGRGDGKLHALARAMLWIAGGESS